MPLEARQPPSRLRYPLREPGQRLLKASHHPGGFRYPFRHLLRQAGKGLPRFPGGNLHLGGLALGFLHRRLVHRGAYPPLDDDLYPPVHAVPLGPR